MKKSIFIFSHSMEIGGAESALIGLLNSIDYDRYDVDLFLLKHGGDFFNLIPKSVNILSENKIGIALMSSIVDEIKMGCIPVAVSRFVSKINSVIYSKKNGISSEYVQLLYDHKTTIKYFDSFNKDYDIAISFLTPHYFVANKVNAKKKIAWIHTDYSTIDVDVKTELRMWNKYDNVISISNDVSKAFLKKFPSLKDKITIIENIASKDFIQSRANDVNQDLFGFNGTKLLSVGRFCEAKNFDNVPEIANIIKSKEIDFKWYIIGYGQDEDLIKSKIAEFGMEDTVIILGKKENPYPYIKNCDIYVQPSRYEGKAVTVHEALILNKPVIIANYLTAKSQLNDGFDGVIVPQDNEGCAEGIAKVVLDKGLQQQLIENMKTVNYSNEYEVEKLYQLIEE